LEGRLLEYALGDPQSNVAFEEALLREGLVPTLRVWENQRSVVIGRAQLARYETDIEYCRERSIPVVRRLTAGGAVYNGPGNVNWTFFFPKRSEGELFPNIHGPKSVFRVVGEFVVGALERCGVACSFEEPNVIRDTSGKVSGMAAYITKDSVLCHGTLLFDADLEEVLRLTKPVVADPPRKYGRSNFATVANVHVAPGPFVRELARTSEGFRGGDVTSEEKGFLERVVSKYRSDGWNYGDPFDLDQA